jgi:hypothetical protein
MAETQYTHSTTGAGQFVGDAGLAVVAVVHGAKAGDAGSHIVWYTLADGTGSLTTATYADAYAIGLALATYGMAAGERVKLSIERGVAPTIVGLTAAATTVRA